MVGLTEIITNSAKVEAGAKAELGNKSNCEVDQQIYWNMKELLSALYCVKSPESRRKVVVMRYQNSSWDICDLTKKVSGPKIFRARSRGPQSWSAGKFEYLEIWIF